MTQLEIPWTRPTKPVAHGKPKGLPYLVNTTCRTFRWYEVSPEAAIKRAEETAKSRKSSTTVYEEVAGQCGRRLAAFNQMGKRFL